MATEEKTKKATPTVATLVDAFLEDLQDRATIDTWRVYRSFFTPFVKIHGKLTADELTTVLVESYARRQGWADSTQNAFLGAVATVFHWAADRAKLIERTPLVGLRRPPKASGRNRWPAGQ